MHVKEQHMALTVKSTIESSLNESLIVLYSVLKDDILVRCILLDPEVDVGEGLFTSLW